MPTAYTNGIVTNYLDEGSGHPVVLIHGLTQSLEAWEPIAKNLVDGGYRVIRHDVRGRGQTEVPKSGYNYRTYTADLLALLDYLQVRQAHLAGLSMGGATVIQFTVTHPHRVSALVPIDAALEGFPFSQESQRYRQEAIRLARQEGPRAAIEKLWLSGPFFAGIRRHPAKWADVRERSLSFPGCEWLDPAPPVAPPDPAISRLKEIHCPTLVIVGELDIQDMRDIADRVAADVPGARKVVIPDCGHVAPMEEPERVSQLLLDFFKEVTPVAAK